MSNFRSCVLRVSSAIAGLLAIVLMLGSCGGGTTTPGPLTSNTGTVTTNISDPPTCSASSGGPFSNVWVTITKVMAHTSADTSLSPSASGWITLVDATGAPMQKDLLTLTTCVLNKLGSVSALPPGNYQQIRILLLSNTPGSGTATPSPNNCSPLSAFNCLVLSANGSKQTLQLSGEDQTGIKVPPGQIAGGAINLTAGQAADINIDFNSCASIVQEGKGAFRLKPALTAGVVSTSKSITGQIVDSSTKKGIPSATVLLEQFDTSSNIDRIVRAGMADSSGNFTFCPLPAGNYDIVAAAEVTSASNVTTTYNATITFAVPAGTAVGTIPLVAESGAAGQSTLPGAISGQVTTVGATAGTPVAANVTFLPLQQATSGTTVRQVTIPLFGSSAQPASVRTASTATTAPPCPTGTDCANYTLLVPGSNPQFGTFSSSGTTYSPPGSPPVNYTLRVEASTCSPNNVTSPGTIIVVGGGASTPTTTNLTLSGCTSP